MTSCDMEKEEEISSEKEVGTAGPATMTSRAWRAGRKGEKV